MNGMQIIIKGMEKIFSYHLRWDLKWGHVLPSKLSYHLKLGWIKVLQVNAVLIIYHNMNI